MKLLSNKKNSHRVFSLLSAAWIIILFSIHRSGANGLILSRFIQPIEFNTRKALKKTPPIDSSLKILAFDDTTLSYIGKPNLPTFDLARVIRNIAAQKPRGIYIDGLMSIPPDPATNDQPWDAILRDVKVPIYTGAHVYPTTLAARPEADLSDQAYQLSTLMQEQTTTLPPMGQKRGWHAYGYSPEYTGLFRAIGHISYNPDSTLSPFYQFSDTIGLRHLSLYAAESLSIDDGYLKVNNKTVPLDQNGSIRINHRPSEQFYKITTSLAYAVKRARNNQPETRIKEGDTVLILLSFATGNTDIHENSPFGEIPGGFLVGAMFDSVLSGRWLQAPEWDNALMVIFGTIGLFWGLQSSALWFWIGSVTFTILIFSASMLSFSYYAVSFPWFFPLMAFHGLGLIHFAHRRFEEELKKISLEKTYFAEKAIRLEEENKMIKMEESLKLGKAVQQLLMPSSLSGEFGSFHYEMKHIPSQTMSGDWFYMWDVGDGEKRIFIGDVMGKGPSAALPVAVLISTMREAQDKNVSVLAAIEILNKRLVDLFGGAVTSSIAAITLLPNHTVEILCAGSPGWFLYEIGKPIQIYPLRGNPLGLKSTIQVEHRVLPLTPECMIFTFTDGYLEGSRAVKRLSRRLNTAEIKISNPDILHQLLLSVAADNPWDDDKSLLSIQAS